jgi:hypothetical protein
MPKLDDVSMSILRRMIEQRETQLRNAELGNNVHLADKLRKEIRGLRAGRKKIESGRGTDAPFWVQTRNEPKSAGRRPLTSGPARRSNAKVRRPKLCDDATVVDPHGARWEALTAYIRKLAENFPREDVTSLTGFFSTEREFARHIRAIESRLPARARRAEPSARKPSARKPSARKASTRKASARKGKAARKRSAQRAKRA